MIRAIYAFAAVAALAAPASAKEWSKDKSWTVTEFDQNACLMRPAEIGKYPFQIVEAADHSGTVSVSGLEENADEPGVLYYGFTNRPFIGLLADRIATQMTDQHEKIDTMLWSLPADPATLMGKPALEMMRPRNFLDIYAQMGSAVMFSTEDNPKPGGYFPIPGAAGAVAALRQCIASRADQTGKETK